jgi:hypothetical protein
VSDYFVCPHCGTQVDIDASVCPECGSDDETGWSEDTAYDGLYPYDDQDDKYARSEKRSTRWVKYAVVVALALTLLAFVTVTVPWGIYLIPLILLAAVVAYYFMEVAPNLRSSQEKKIYETLLTRAGGDGAMVERWISYERRRTPDAGELEQMEAALYRWQRDNM